MAAQRVASDAALAALARERPLGVRDPLFEAGADAPAFLRVIRRSGGAQGEAG
jgi:hypothetical protein